VFFLIFAILVGQSFPSSPIGRRMTYLPEIGNVIYGSVWISFGGALNNDLSFSAITDSDLESLYELKNLATVVVEDTKVTENGIKNLKKKLPKIKILHD
jgi:hypothetical protein